MVPYTRNHRLRAVLLDLEDINTPSDVVELNISLVDTKVLVDTEKVEALDWVAVDTNTDHDISSGSFTTTSTTHPSNDQYQRTLLLPATKMS